MLVVAVGAILASGAWWLLRGDDEAPPVESGAYVEGLAGTFQRVNPLFAPLNEVDEDIASLVFAGLVRLTPGGILAPDLAQLPDLSADGRTYTFHLRPGVSWHDGQPLTSRDFAFTVSLLRDPDFRGPASLAQGWDGVEVDAPNDQTIVLRLKQPSAPFVARNATIGLLPQHLLKDLPAAALFDAPFNTAPIGAGPYRLQSIDAREAVLLANERYHEGKPTIARIRLRFFTDYPSATAAYAAGQVDAVFVRDTISPARLAELRTLRSTKLEANQRAAYLVLYLNNDQALFSDSRVRRAIALIVDRKPLVDRLYGGLATASSSAVPPGTWAYEHGFDDTTANVIEARSLLDEAGWTVSATTSVRTREGTEFRFTVRTDNDPDRVAIASELARQLEAVGIKASVASTTFLVLQRDFLSQRRYDAAVVGWDQGADPDPYFGWHSSQKGSASGALNVAQFEDIVVDQLIATARTSSDDVVRKSLYRQFQQKWNELAPSVVLLYPQYVYLRRSAIDGPAPGTLATPSQRFYNIHTWKP